MKTKKPLSQRKLSKLELELSAKAEQSKSLKTWFAYRWGQFETWVHSWYPGLKTKIILGLGVLGSAAATLQEFVGGLPVTEYISAKTMSLVTMGLFAAAFWFKNMGERTEARAEEIN